MRAWLGGVAVAGVLLTEGCGREAAAVPDPVAPGQPAWVVGELVGSPATGPGTRWNRCERVWCLVHEENYFVAHFLEGHRGWILHTEDRGDVFSPASGPDRRGFPTAKLTAIRLCGQHLHPWMLGRGSGAIRHTGFNRTLGYGRGHWGSYGTRLEPCCLNGVGWAWLHTSAGRRFPFHDVEAYRSDPGRGWSRLVRADLR
jgi:hypothetical protein